MALDVIKPWNGGNIQYARYDVEDDGAVNAQVFAI